MPVVARHYGLPAESLGSMLAGDGDLWVDSGGRLFFAESHVPDPAEAEAAAGSEAGFLAASPAPLDQTFHLHSRPSATRKIVLDFARIRQPQNLPLLPDDHGDSPATATALGTNALSAAGIIGSDADEDVLGIPDTAAWANTRSPGPTRPS